MTKPKKRGPGRPALPPAKVRETPLVVRLRPGERAAYAAAAKAAGLTLSAWVRARLDAGL